MYSVTIAGIISALALPALAQWGFTESCAQEIVGLGIPTLLSLLGLAIAWFGRWRAGGIKLSGARK